MDLLFKSQNLSRTAYTLQERKMVFILSRRGKGVQTGGASRVLNNEDVMVDAIRALLEQRGQGE